MQANNEFQENAEAKNKAKYTKKLQFAVTLWFWRNKEKSQKKKKKF